MSPSISDNEDDGVHSPGASSLSYQRVSLDDDEITDGSSRGDNSHGQAAANKALRNFLAMAVLFSANHGCVVSCLALASSRLGSTGAWQSGILFITYAASSVLGATYAVKKLGPRNAITLGMACYCFYVGCFYLATLLETNETNEANEASETSETIQTTTRTAAYLGAAIGGIGAGFLWTAQGTYFGLAATDHSSLLRTPLEESNAKMAGYFAFLYLSEELLLRLLSSFLLEFDLASWGTIFGIYTLVAVASTLAMPCVHDYPSDDDDEDGDEDGHGENTNTNTNNINNSTFRKATVAIKLLRDDPKMKHMIGLNAVFGFVSAFLNSYVNGQVLPVALDDPDSRYVGVFTSTVSLVAAVMSLLFGKLGGSSNSNSSSGNGNSGIILVLGALCFGGVVLPFVIQPDASHYGWFSLLIVYTLHGTGRATFEGTLRSTFADYFSYEKEGAFANIVLQNGIAGGVGYILTFALACDTPSKYCVEYSNGTLHDVWTFEFISLVSVVVAIGGYLRASKLHREGNTRPMISREQREESGNGSG